MNTPLRLVAGTTRRTLDCSAAGGAAGEVRETAEEVCEDDPQAATANASMAIISAANQRPPVTAPDPLRSCGSPDIATSSAQTRTVISVRIRRVTGHAPRSSDTDAVVFDLGGVLLDWDPRYLYRSLFDDEAEMERFLGEICTLEWHAAHDRGVPMAQSCAALAAVHPRYANLINAWSERSEEMIAGPIDGTVEILEELLQQGVRCYALTNMERETYPLRRQRFPFMSWFAGTVVSSHEGVAKPDPEIFHLLLDRFGLTAERTVMIDDSQPNIDTAARLGMTAVRFTSPTALRAALTGLRLKSYPSDRERY